MIHLSASSFLRGCGRCSCLVIGLQEGLVEDCKNDITAMFINSTKKFFYINKSGAIGQHESITGRGSIF